MVINLPFPPALNNLFATYNNRRIPSRRYKQWLADAASALSEQAFEPVKGSFTAHIECRAPDRRKRDLDGLLKAPLDFLVKAGVVEDDSHARRLSIAWSPLEPGKPGCVRIHVVPA